MVKILIKTVTLFIFLTSVDGISQTKNSEFQFLFKKHLDSIILSNSFIFWNTTKTSFQSKSAILTLFEKQLLFHNKKTTNLSLREKTLDTVNRKILKAKMDAEKWICTQPNPEMIAAKKAVEEGLKKNKN